MAVQSHWFSVGATAAWTEAGVGAIATQAMVNASYGPLGLDLMRTGTLPAQALDTLLAGDKGRDLRQVAFVDAGGRTAAHTGARCLREAGHIAGDGFVVQANMMLRATVWPAMARAFETTHGDFAERLLRVLEAAQDAGGDIRGQQSACMRIVSGDRGAPWESVRLDLRVEDHPHPLGELRRLVQTDRAYRLMNEGDECLGKGEIERALQAYGAACSIVPDKLEPPFWYAVALADQGRVEEAMPLFERVVMAEPSWAELFARLTAAGLARENPQLLKRLQALVAGAR